MRTNKEIKRLIKQLDKKANEHKRKIDIIKRIKYLIKASSTKRVETSKNLNKE